METFGLKHASMNEFSDWLNTAKHGDTLAYACGEIARTIEIYKKEAAEIIGVRELAWQASLAHKIVLTQRRIDQNSFQYIATRTVLKRAKRSYETHISLDRRTKLVLVPA